MSLYTQHYALNAEGQKLSQETRDVLKPLIENYVKEGHSIVEISACMESALGALLAESRLREGLRVRGKAAHKRTN